MNPSFVRRIDLYDAVKHDIRLHGFRSTLLEFLVVGPGTITLKEIS